MRGRGKEGKGERREGGKKGRGKEGKGKRREGGDYLLWTQTP